MKKSKFSITHKDDEMWELIKKTDKKILAIWAIDCTERVLPYFEEKYPDDPRPRKAIETLQEWIKTGIFKMSVIRKASLDSHAAARDVGEDNAARPTGEARLMAAQSAARAAGQAVATAHVYTHSYGPAIYAQQAIHRATAPEHADEAVAKERNWQYKHLIELRKKS